MSIMYSKKAKTQGHLRNIMVDDYKNIRNSLIIWNKYKVSHTTVLKRSNKDSLENKSSAPINPARKHELKDLYLIYFLYKKENLNWDDIVDCLLNNYLVTIPRSSIYYYLNIWWLIKERRCKQKEISKQFKKYDPWFLHIDITYWPKIDWKKYYLHIAIDRATRLIYIEIHENKKASTAALFLENALKFFPFKIEKILTDNWKEYTLKNHKWKYNNLIWAFDFVCNEFNIEHRLTEYNHPQTNWMVEKLNDTIKSNTIKKYTYENIQDMKNNIIWFMIYYILERRHSSLIKEIQLRTPFEALEYWYKIKPEIFIKDLFVFKQELLNIRKNL